MLGYKFKMKNGHWVKEFAIESEGEVKIFTSVGIITKRKRPLVKQLAA